MSDAPQPEVRWAPQEPRPRNVGKIWFLSILGVLAVAAIVAGLLLFLPRTGDPESTPAPTGTAAPSASATSTASVSPTPTSTSTPSSAPTTEPTTPVQTQPPAVDPDLPSFRSEVQPRLDDAVRGLDLARQQDAEGAGAVVDSLQIDAQILSDAVAPSSVATAWADGVTAYIHALDDLRSAVSTGGGFTAETDAARSAVNQLRSLVGL